MNKKHPVIPFLSGVLATVLTMGCVTTALAASGLVQFSPVGLQLNRKAIFAAGDSVETESGQSVPSSLLYTDAGGAALPICRCGPLQSCWTYPSPGTERTIPSYWAGAAQAAQR